MRKKKSLHITHKSKDGKEKLIYLRAGKMNDFKTQGFVYRHEWETGFQELVFESHERAAKFFTQVPL